LILLAHRQCGGLASLWLVNSVYVPLQFLKLEIRVKRGVAKLRFVTDGAFSWPDEQVYHSTQPFENLRVLSVVEGLMALSKTLSNVEGSRIEGLVWMAKEEPHMNFKHPSAIICVDLCPTSLRSLRLCARRVLRFRSVCACGSDL